MTERQHHKEAEDSKESADKPKSKRSRVWQAAIAAVLIVLAIIVATSAYLYAVSPASIRSPKMEHYHFRMQLLVNGKPVSFSGQPFQTPYEKGQCSAELSVEPIHFHDQKDQFVHIHWDGMTGGMVLKNYGWNFIGGASSVLGYRMDDLPRVKAVPVHGSALPVQPEGSNFWIYTGDGNSYQKRSFDDFKTQNLEQFFNKRSNFMSTYGQTKNQGLFDWLFPKVMAHDGQHTEQSAHSGQHSEDELTRLNNLIGNVVIFVQRDEPSDQQIKDRFAHLAPLSDSTCGG